MRRIVVLHVSEIEEAGDKVELAAQTRGFH